MRLAQPLEQFQHLRLHRDVQRRDRFVGDDQLRVERQRAGDAEALALAAGELVRVTGHGVGGQADVLEQRGDPLAAFGQRQAVVNQQRLADQFQHRLARVERSVGVLEDHLHVAPHGL
ncbi:hypothetical protein PAERUG_P54_1_London_24_VIM_2_04_13_04031 [Pseudomonas aeruginosa]|nr:hypothetical protein PAERUG_P54_1_London_24_VIM_2_04_13_04031 [Pseudomonas aeruginosa]